MPSAPPTPTAPTAPGEPFDAFAELSRQAAPPAPPPASASAVGGPKRRKRRLPWLVAAVAVLVATFASGWAIAENRANDRLAAVEASAPIPVDSNVSAPATPDAAEADEPAPTAEPAPATAEVVPPIVDDSGVEPASAAAARVAPAVVLIDVPNFGQGSGIVYDADGRIVTNAHVVGTATDVNVVLANGRRVEGTVIGRDTRVDVAVIEIDATEIPAVAEFAADDTVAVGQLAVAIGSPFGLDQTVTAGIVSAIDRVIDNGLEEQNPVGMLQTDAPINPGNSGGALVDREGRVIGMNTSIRTDGTDGNLGVGFAIPSDTIRLIADRIINGEPLDFGLLGVNLDQPVTGDAGALVVSANEGGPAANAGIVEGDLVVGFDGEPVRSTFDLAAKVRITTPDTAVELDIIRNGETITIEVVIGNLGDA